MILTDYGGSGLGLRDATVVMEEINRSGQMFNMGTRLRHGSEVQKQQRYLPKIESGEWRLQSMCVMEPSTDTTKIKTTEVKTRVATAKWSTARRSGSCACSTPTG